MILSEEEKKKTAAFRNDHQTESFFPELQLIAFGIVLLGNKQIKTRNTK